MTDSENFNALVDRAMEIKGRAHMRPVITKELLLNENKAILSTVKKSIIASPSPTRGGKPMEITSK